MRSDSKRLVLEGLVVVASILIAFLLDAWWSDRQTARQLDQELGSVARELGQNGVLIAYEIETLERLIAGNEAFVALFEDVGSAETVAVSDTLLFLTAFWSPTLDLSFGALDALITSGRLAQIEDVEVRLGLAGLRGRVADAVGNELLAQMMLQEQVFPGISRRADFSVVYRIDNEMFSQPPTVGLPVPSEGLLLSIPNSAVIKNAVLNRTSWLGSAVGKMRSLADHVEHLNSMIAAGSD